MTFARLLLAVLLTAILPARAVVAQQLDSLISQLADSDPQKRTSAETALRRMGAEARPALIEASRRENDPAVSSAAARVLLALPWNKPNDPPLVHTALSDYGRRDESDRIKVIAVIGAQEGDGPRAALLRLIVEDPSEDVCWQIAKVLRLRWSPEMASQLRRINPPDTRSAAALLVGLAWRNTDREQALGFFRRAVEIEARHPANDQIELPNGRMENQLDLAFEELTDAAVGAGKFDDAAEVRRQQAARVSLSRDPDPRAVYELFALHGQFGPLKGMAQDMQDFREYMGDPGVLYCLSRAYGRAGRTLEAMALRATARSASLTMQSHFDVAWFFNSIGWEDVARIEAYAVLSAPGDPGNALDQQFRAREILAGLASHEENEAAVIDHLNGAIAVMNSTPNMGWPRGNDPFGTEFIQVQIAWRKAKLALAAGDAAETRKNLDEMMSLNPSEQPDVVLNAYPLLKATGRQNEADELFQIAYATAKAGVDKDPENATDANDLAWLCAKCDQRLEEALALSKQAVAASPENSAFIDTLAEVQFRLGNPVEAARLETRALELRPDDTFMTHQRERFLAAAADHQR